MKRILSIFLIFLILFNFSLTSVSAAAPATPPDVTKYIVESMKKAGNDHGGLSFINKEAEDMFYRDLYKAQKNAPGMKVYKDNVVHLKRSTGALKNVVKGAGWLALTYLVTEGINYAIEYNMRGNGDLLAEYDIPKGMPYNGTAIGFEHVYMDFSSVEYDSRGDISPQTVKIVYNDVIPNGSFRRNTTTYLGSLWNGIDPSFINFSPNSEIYIASNGIVERQDYIITRRDYNNVSDSYDIKVQNFTIGIRNIDGEYSNVLDDFDVISDHLPYRDYISHDDFVYNPDLQHVPEIDPEQDFEFDLDDYPETSPIYAPDGEPFPDEVFDPTAPIDPGDNVLLSIWEWLLNLLPFIQQIIDILQNILNWLNNLFPFIQQIIHFLEQIFNWLLNLITELGVLLSSLLQPLIEILNNIFAFLEGLITNIGDLFNILLSPIISLLQNIIDFLNGLISDLIISLQSMLIHLFIPSQNFLNEPLENILTRFNTKFPDVDHIPAFFGALRGECRAVNNIEVTLYGQTMTIVDMSYLVSASDWFKPIMSSVIWLYLLAYIYRKIASIISDRGGSS